MRQLASDVRTEYGFSTPRVTKSDLRRIYRAERIELVLWSGTFRRVRGAYFNDDLGMTVMIDRKLPDEPAIFTMAHELKHHFVDSDGTMTCYGDDTDLREIAAEVFAAELIFPQELFQQSLEALVTGKCLPEHLVHLKANTRTTMSYAGLAKMAVRLGYLSKESTEKVRWKKLEEQLLGVPLYKHLLSRRSLG